MREYKLIKLNDLLKNIGENETNAILSTFRNPLNSDIEHFLLHNAITFEKQHISSTYLVFTNHQSQQILCGYFTLANKILTIYGKSLVSTNIKKRISKFSTYDPFSDKFSLSTPLIAQLGKNYYQNYNLLINGCDLLELAIQKLRSALEIIGGNIVYLECKDIPNLVAFYTQNNFISVGKRYTTFPSNTRPNYLLQMIRFVK